jgi:hypothetical protein
VFVEIFSCQISVQIQNGGFWTYKEQYEIETTDITTFCDKTDERSEEMRETGADL